MTPEKPNKNRSEFEAEYFTQIEAIDKKFLRFKAEKEKEILNFKSEIELEKSKLEKKYLPLIVEAKDPGTSGFSYCRSQP